MGQGLGCGALVGGAAALAVTPLQMPIANHVMVLAGCCGAGLTVDLASDMFAKEGKVLIHRDVVLSAEDVIRHVYTFYCPCDANPVARALRLKHEWLVLESHTHRFYTVQKAPATGDVRMDVRLSLRSANDLGLTAAGRPTQTGEIRQHRADMEFDLPNDVMVAYMIAWLRKEDPRWALSTENSRQFTMRARYALNDF